MTGTLRIKALDSLRGIASLIVVFSHFYSIWPETMRDQVHWLNHTPLRIMTNGRGAVTLFFVLSGFVLALPYYSGKILPYKDFILRRFCRIYLPFLASIGLAVVLFELVGNQIPTGEVSTWVYRNWLSGSDSWKAILRHLAMTGTSNDMSLNHNMWTLVIEMRVSLIFPLLIALVGNIRRGMIVGGALYLASTAWLIYLGPLVDESFADTDQIWIALLITVRYVVFFMIGILLAKFLPKMQGYAEAWPLSVKLMLWALCAVIFILPHYRQEEILQSIATVLSILLVTVQPRLRQTLSVGPLAWLGSRSYSLYLIHTPVILAIFHTVYGALSFGLTVAISLAACLLITEAFYVVIERPAMELGRKLTTKKAAA